MAGVCAYVTVFSLVCFCTLSIFLMKKVVERLSENKVCCGFENAMRNCMARTSLSTSVCWLKNSVLSIALVPRCFTQCFRVYIFFPAFIHKPLCSKKNKSNAEAWKSSLQWWYHAVFFYVPLMWNALTSLMRHTFQKFALFHCAHWIS